MPDGGPRPGHDPSSFVIHPTDWEGVELALSTTNSVEHQGLPYNPAIRALYGVPVVVSLAQAAGVGHLLAVDSVALDTDQRGIDISWSESATADSFQRNIVHIRVEGRYGTSVYQPASVVSIDLTA